MDNSGLDNHDRACRSVDNYLPRIADARASEIEGPNQRETIGELGDHQAADWRTMVRWVALPGPLPDPDCLQGILQSGGGGEPRRRKIGQIGRHLAVAAS